MSLGIDRAVCLLTGFCFTLGVVALSALGMAHAQDAVPPLPPACDRCEHRVEEPLLGIDPVAVEFFERATRALSAEFGTGMRFRVTLPHPQLFSEKDCSGEGCLAEKIIHSGACEATCESLPAPTFTAKFLRLGCPCAAVANAPAAAKHRAARIVPLPVLRVASAAPVLPKRQRPSAEKSAAN